MKAQAAAPAWLYLERARAFCLARSVFCEGKAVDGLRLRLCPGWGIIAREWSSGSV
jgi:hypothetical protein